MGSREFATVVKEQLGYRSKGRKIIEGNGAYELRGENGSYTSHFDGKMKDIDVKTPINGVLIKAHQPLSVARPCLHDMPIKNRMNLIAVTFLG